MPPSLSRSLFQRSDSYRTLKAVQPMFQDTDRALTHHPHPHTQPGEHPLHTMINEELAVPAEGDADDGASEASSSGLPPPLITANQYKTLVCQSCVLEIPALQKYTGTSDALTVARKPGEDPWTVVAKASNVDANVEIDVKAGVKRSRATSTIDEHVGIHSLTKLRRVLDRCGWLGEPAGWLREKSVW